MMEIKNEVYSTALVEWAVNKPEVVVFSGDLTGSTEINAFKNAYPDRFFSMGMAEQNMLGWAGGMAREGYTPFLHTFAVFLYRRALDQLSMSIAYPNLRVRLIGFLPGIMTPGGATHQAIDDLAIMRAIPNMNILEMGDVTDIESSLDVIQSIDGPVYVRMLRGKVPRHFPANEPLRFNHARVLSEGTDVSLMTSGICTGEALRVTKALRSRGVSIHHLHISTLKPFTDPKVEEAIKKATRGVITYENHSILGGLGTAVAEVMASMGAPVPLVRMGIPDRYLHGASQEYLAKEVGLDGISLVRQFEKLLGRSLDVEEDELTTTSPSEKQTVKADQTDSL